MKPSIAKPRTTNDETKPPLRCCRCEKLADVAMPIMNTDYKGASSAHGRYIPDPVGRMLCWDCYEGK